MNDSLKIIAVFFICFCLYSCKENKGNKIYTDFFVNKEPKEFVRTENTDEFEYYQYVCTDSSEFIVNLDKYRNILNFFDYKSGNIVQNMKIPIARKISAFYYDNINSIYIIPSYDFKILEYKNQAQVDTVFSLNPTDDNFLYYALKSDLGISLEFFPTIFSPFLLKDSIFYVGNLTVPDKNAIDDRRPLFLISANNNEYIINTKIARLPKERIFFPLDIVVPYALNNKQEVVVSYCMDNDLYIFKDTSLINKVNCKSNFVEKLPPSISIDQMEDKKIMEERVKSIRYFGIYYDCYRNLYYRVVKDYDNMNILSIIFLNESFDIIGEQLFENDEYVIDLIVAKEGIMLRKPDDLSGITRYTVFEINKKYLN